MAPSGTDERKVGAAQVEAAAQGVDGLATKATKTMSDKRIVFVFIGEMCLLFRLQRY